MAFMLKKKEIFVRLMMMIMIHSIYVMPSICLLNTFKGAEIEVI